MRGIKKKLFGKSKYAQRFIRVREVPDDRTLLHCSCGEDIQLFERDVHEDEGHFIIAREDTIDGQTYVRGGQEGVGKNDD